MPKPVQFVALSLIPLLVLLAACTGVAASKDVVVSPSPPPSSSWEMLCFEALQNTSKAAIQRSIWSPDGMWQAYLVADGVAEHLCLTSIDSDQVHHLAFTLNIEALWSPDSTKLAIATGFRGGSTGGFEISVFDVNSQATMGLDLYPSGCFGETSYAVRPDWSPDSTRMAFVGRGIECHEQRYMVDLRDSTVVPVDDTFEW